MLIKEVHIWLQAQGRVTATAAVHPAEHIQFAVPNLLQLKLLAAYSRFLR